MRVAFSVNQGHHVAPESKRDQQGKMPNMCMKKVNDKDGTAGSENALTAEVASMHHLLDANQKTTLAKIKQSTPVVDAEARTPVLMSQMEQMCKWVNNLEAQGRRNNL